MLLEIRTYRLHPGVRDRFVAWFMAEARPAMEEAGLPVIGPFVDDEDPDVFVYLRTFVDHADRDRRCEAFYASPVWLETLREPALSMEESYEVRLVEAVPGGTVPNGSAPG